MKRLIYGVLFVLLAWTAYQNDSVRDFVEQGPGEYLAKLRNFLDDYSPEALQREFADSFQPNTEARDYLEEISRSRESLDEFFFQYCEREAIDHPVLSSTQLEKACDSVGRQLGRK